MLIGLLNILFVLLCFFIIFIVLLQKSKGSLGMVGSFGSTNILFGGSGGQDFFQKVTWGAIAFFMFGSLGLSLLKNRSVTQSRYLEQAIASSSLAMPVIPAQSQPVQQDVPIPQQSPVDSSAR
jgi:protein translocase SecG subunit